MGDGRRYDWVIALRAVGTVDFMTARRRRAGNDCLIWINMPGRTVA